MNPDPLVRRTLIRVDLNHIPENTRNQLSPNQLPPWHLASSVKLCSAGEICASIVEREEVWRRVTGGDLSPLGAVPFLAFLIVALLRTVSMISTPEMQCFFFTLEDPDFDPFLESSLSMLI